MQKVHFWNRKTVKKAQDLSFYEWYRTGMKMTKKLKFKKL